VVLDCARPQRARTTGIRRSRGRLAACKWRRKEIRPRAVGGATSASASIQWNHAIFIVRFRPGMGWSERRTENAKRPVTRFRSTGRLPGRSACPLGRSTTAAPNALVVWFNTHNIGVR
jgi:hypothetical protein